jgi:hypothetical protein
MSRAPGRAIAPAARRCLADFSGVSARASTAWLEFIAGRAAFLAFPPFQGASN